MKTLMVAPNCLQDRRKRVLDMFDTMLSDNVKAWIKQPDGLYIKASEIKETSQLPSLAEQLAEEKAEAAGEAHGRAQSAPPAEKINSQEEFFKRAYNKTL